MHGCVMVTAFRHLHLFNNLTGLLVSVMYTCAWSSGQDSCPAISLCLAGVSLMFLSLANLAHVSLLFSRCPGASVVHASGTGQLPANPPVASLRFNCGRPTKMAVTTMGSSDLVVGEDHLLGPNCLCYSWQTDR